MVPINSDLLQKARLLRQSRKLAYRVEDMPVEKIERIAANEMDKRHLALDEFSGE